MPAKNKGRGRAPKNQHQLCQALPEGEVLTDLKKKSWKLGTAVGSGGFGLIYTADENSKVSVKANASYVIKVEPHGNGPLYSEIAYYQRVAKRELIEEWRKRKKLSFVPIPCYIAHGLHTHEGESLRFLVMPRFGADLHKLWLSADKRFKRETVAKIAIMMLDALEYMHEKEYVHADIKGANILCAHNNSKQLFLADYGLAYRYIVDDEHKRYKPEPKKAHNGTIEYTSTDAHDGANPSRRGDIEILGFFLLHLLAGELPWEDNLKDCNYVRDSKKQHLKRPDNLVKSLCGTSIPEISKLLEHSTKLEYDEKPSYDRLRDLFKSSLKSMSVALTSSLDFSSADKSSSCEESPVKQRAKAKKRKIVGSHPSNSKARKKAGMTSSNDDDVAMTSSSVESEATPAPSTGPRRQVARRKAASSFSTEDSSPVVVKTRQRKAPVIVSDSEEYNSSKDFSVEDFSSPIPPKPKTKTAKSKVARPTKSKPRRQASNSENEKPKLVNGILIPKPTKPPTSTKSRSSPRKKTPLQSSPPPVVDSDSDESIDYPVTSKPKSPRKPKQSSRFSMAPLHTDPVLTEKDKLTGKYIGKHPVFVRKRKQNLPKTDASTQTTPDLKRNASKK